MQVKGFNIAWRNYK